MKNKMNPLLIMSLFFSFSIMGNAIGQDAPAEPKSDTTAEPASGGSTTDKVIEAGNEAAEKNMDKLLPKKTGVKAMPGGSNKPGVNH